ncbi:hypothetical protein [Vibrio sp. AND4]|uniref:hypothetical protein n=1 Tax=Vibrio sp. AND4 TaxID=314289 RepID=UPI00015EFBC1|nr:hypothetical protein [Vibrio sp. AND4]EDP60162.1 hypothetical protein AND4_02098 [Vibrio sp. AND4]
MNKYNILASLVLSVPAFSQTFSIIPSVETGLPTVLEQPNLFQAPVFDFYNFSDGYLEQRANAKAELPLSLSHINRVCIENTFSELNGHENYAQSGILLYTYKNDTQGDRLYNTTIGDRVPLESISEHCFDESTWVYKNWLQDGVILFTPYSTEFSILEGVRVKIDGEFELPTDSALFIKNYFDFISKVGFDQSARFYHPSSIEKIKSLIINGIDSNSENIIALKNMSFGERASKVDIALMSSSDFMNNLLGIVQKINGSNNLNFESLHIINEFDLDEKKYINVQRKERVLGQLITVNEVVTLKKHGSHWLIDIPESISDILSK